MVSRTETMIYNCLVPEPENSWQNNLKTTLSWTWLWCNKNYWTLFCFHNCVVPKSVPDGDLLWLVNTMGYLGATQNCHHSHGRTQHILGEGGGVKSHYMLFENVVYYAILRVIKISISKYKTSMLCILLIMLTILLINFYLEYEKLCVTSTEHYNSYDSYDLAAGCRDDLLNHWPIIKHNELRNPPINHLSLMHPNCLSLIELYTNYV